MAVLPQMSNPPNHHQTMRSLVSKKIHQNTLNGCPHHTKLAFLHYTLKTTKCETIFIGEEYMTNVGAY